MKLARIALGIALTFFCLLPELAHAGLRPGDILVREPTVYGEIMRIDPVTGAATHLSSGGLLGYSGAGIAVAPTREVFSAGERGVVRIDPDTGEQSLLSPLGGLHGIAIDADGELLLTQFGISGSPPAVLRMNPTTGAWTTVSAGGLLRYPFGIAISEDGTLYLADGALYGNAGALIRIDPASGAQSVLAQGGLLVKPSDVAVGPDGFLYVADAEAFGGNCPNNGCGGIIRVDQVTGEQRAVSSGGHFTNPVYITVDSQGHLLVTDWHAFAAALPKIIRVSPETREQFVLSTESPSPGDLAVVPGIPTPPEPACGDRIVNQPTESCDGTDTGTCGGPCRPDCTCFEGMNPGDLIVTDKGLRAIVEIDRVTGDRTVLSSDTVGHGPGFFAPTGVAVRSDGKIFVTDPFTGQVLRVDPRTGDRSVVAFSTILLPWEIPSHLPVDVALSPDAGIFTLDHRWNGILRVNESTGERTLVSGSGIGGGDPFDFPWSIEIDGSGEALVSQFNSGTILDVDLTTGDRTLLSGWIWGYGRQVVGAGPLFRTLEGLAIEHDGNLLAVEPDALGGTSLLYRVQRDSGDRAILSGCLFQFRQPCVPVGQGPGFFYAHDVTVGPAGEIIVSDPYQDAIFQVEPATGNRSIVASPTRGRGPELLYPWNEDVVPADLDSDGDGILDDGDQSGAADDLPCGLGPQALCDDNCRLIANPGQENFDHDARGDACDADDDNDGLDDAVESNTRVFVSATDAGTDPLDRDTDDDGIEDGLELTLGTNPVLADSDGDGVLDGRDVDILRNAIAFMPDAAFAAPIGHRKALVRLARNIETALAKGDTQRGLKELSNISRRTDGCGSRPDRDDWIVDCTVQETFRAVIDLLAANLGG